MFEQLAGSENLRAAATLPSHENVDFNVFDRRTGTVGVEIVISGRTTGTVTADLLGSFNGGSTYPATHATTGAVSTNGWKYLIPSTPLPADLRVSLTPAGGFDGTVQVRYRSAGLVENG